MDKINLGELEKLLERISGPWRSMREGNQYLNDGAEVVGASRVDGLDRPWNPRYVIAPSDLEEVSRFRDDDADFIAAAPAAIRFLLSRLRTLEAALHELANAADNVGVRHFDTDTMSPEVEAMQAATLHARAALEGSGK